MVHRPAHVLYWLITIFRSVFQFPAKPVQPVAKGLGAAGELLRQWDAAHTAAGNHGDLYDNHDGGHSVMKCENLPQFTRDRIVATGPRKLQLHNGATPLRLTPRRPWATLPPR